MIAGGRYPCNFFDVEARGRGEKEKAPRSETLSFYKNAFVILLSAG